MKNILFIILFITSSLYVQAQCFDYQGEMQNAETMITAANRNLKKALKKETLEEAQQLVDKAIFQTDMAIATLAQAKDYATDCNCEDGVNSIINISNAAFDYRNLSQKTADSGSIDELKDVMKNNLELGQSVLDEIAEALSLCLE